METVSSVPRRTALRFLDYSDSPRSGESRRVRECTYRELWDLVETISCVFPGSPGDRIALVIVDDCIELNKKIACRLITVDAYKVALPFYQKSGFEFLTEKDEQENIRQMFLDLQNLDN